MLNSNVLSSYMLPYRIIIFGGRNFCNTERMDYSRFVILDTKKKRG